MEFAARPLANDNSSELIFGRPSHWEEKLVSRIGHTCQLDIDQVAEFPRETCIICTLGESWCTHEGIKQMIDNGMNILRLNLSVHSREICRKAIQITRALDEASDFKHCTSVAMDLVAECVRTGFFEGGPKSTVTFKEGDEVELVFDEAYKNKCTKEKIFINISTFPQMIHYLHKGDRIFLGSGLICLFVKEIGMDHLICKVEEGGPMSGYQRVILPRERLNHRTLESNYVKDLTFAAECDVDFVFTSFADNAQMIIDAKAYLPPNTKVFANIETKESVRNLAQIIEHADGIVVSRADLGIEFPPEKIFKLQKYIIGNTNVARKPVFVTAQLMESMYNKPRPTRAEASDVANAVLDGADGLVLTVETAEGIYPLEAVQIMSQICREAERARFHKTIRAELYACRQDRGLCRKNSSHVTALSAVEAAENCQAKGIFVVTTTGNSVVSVVTAGPCCPVIAITRHPQVARHLRAYRGLFPFVYTGEKLESWSEDMDMRINAAVTAARHAGIVRPQNNVIIVTGSIAGSGNTNTMQVFQVPGEKSSLKVVSSKHKICYSDLDLRELRLANGNGDKEHFQRGPNGVDIPLCPL